MDKTTALKVGCAFGGGISSTGNLCGAVTGGLMVIGLKHGRSKLEDMPAKDKTYALGQQFMAEFTKREGSIVCRELLGFDLSTPEGKAKFSSDIRHKQFCTGCVREAAEILDSLL